MSILSADHFHNEEAAYAWVEAHVWPKGPVCPHCNEPKRISKMGGKSTRIGTYKCYACRKPFTVKIGTIFEASHIPLNKWLQAIFLMCSSKKGISSNQLHRILKVTLKSAWFMSHRIREALRSGPLSPPMGSAGGIVEVDETYIGVNPKINIRTAYHHKFAVLTLIDREGDARSFHIERADRRSIIPLVNANIAKEALVVTDDAALYKQLRRDGRRHESVQHIRLEWARGEIHTNTVEGYFSIFKRGMKGVYQHCGERHLHRYLAEFDFRYNQRVARGVNDEHRAAKALKGVVGKRLPYRTTDRKIRGAAVT